MMPKKSTMFNNDDLFDDFEPETKPAKKKHQPHVRNNDKTRSSEVNSLAGDYVTELFGQVEHLIQTDWTIKLGKGQDRTVVEQYVVDIIRESMTNAQDDLDNQKLKAH